MNTAQQTMLDLLKAALWGQERYPFALPDEASMAAVTQELEDQRVRSLPADVLGALGDRAAIAEAAGRIRRAYGVLAVQTQVMQALENSGIAAVILKGFAAAVNYPKPEYRTLGDIDLLVKPEDFSRAADVLTGLGAACYSGKPRHYGFLLGAVNIELHRYFTAEGDKPLDAKLCAAIDRRETASVLGTPLPVLPPLESGLVLLEHIHQHLRSGLGLRQIVDWACYAGRYLSDDFYRRSFAPAAKAVGLEKLAVTVTALCQSYLGLDAGIAWCAAADEAVVRQLMELLLQRGDFGVKDQASANTVSVLHLAKHPIKFLGQLQTMGCNTWSALKKHPFLKPFAWLYQLCRLVRRGLSRENALKSLRTDMTAARQQQALLRSLGLE